jgi:hypothetical protein
LNRWGIDRSPVVPTHIIHLCQPHSRRLPIMFDYTLDIQAKIKEQEARKANERRVLIREIEDANRAKLDAKKKAEALQPIERKHDSHN